MKEPGIAFSPATRAERAVRTDLFHRNHHGFADAALGALQVPHDLASQIDRVNSTQPVGRQVPDLAEPSVRSEVRHRLDTCRIVMPAAVRAYGISDRVG